MIQTLPSCILFDLDGTLLDSLPGVEFSVREAFQTCGLAVRCTDLRSMIGPPIRVILAKSGDVNDTSTLDALESAFRTSYDGEGWRKTICFPGAHALLSQMRGCGQRLFIVSNKPRHISLRILEALGIAGLFEEVVTADSRVPKYRDKEEMLITLMSRAHLTAAQCLFVGDTMEDAEAAARAGVSFAFMTHGYGRLDPSMSRSIRLQFDDFSQLVRLVSRSCL